MMSLKIDLPHALQRCSSSFSSDGGDEPVPDTPKLEDLWTLGDILGRGGFASVRACSRREDGLRAACKLLPPSSLRSHKLRRQLAREIDVMRFIAADPVLAGNPHLVQASGIFAAAAFCLRPLAPHHCNTSAATSSPFALNTRSQRPRFAIICPKESIPLLCGWLKTHRLARSGC